MKTNNIDNSHDQKENNLFVVTQVLNDVLLEFPPDVNYTLNVNTLDDIENNNNIESDLVINKKFMFAFINQTVAAECINGSALNVVILDKDNFYSL